MLCILLSSAFAALLAISSTVAFRWWSKMRNAENKIASWMPTVPRIPIVGSIFTLGNPTEVLKNVGRIIDNPCKSSYMEMLGNAYIVTKDPEILKCVLSSNKMIAKGDIYNFLIPWLGEGVLISKGEKWRSQRKAITPAFHFSILQSFVDVFDSKADIMVKKLKREELGKNSFNICQYLTDCTLDIICETAMGIDLKSQEKSNCSDYIEAIQMIIRVIDNRSSIFWKNIDWLFNLTRNSWILAKSLKIAHEFTNSVIDERKGEMVNGKGKQGALDQDALSKKNNIAFLDLLLNSTINGQPLTREEIRQEVDTVMFAGHDTTSTGISYLIYVLANRPDIQKQLREEVEEVLESKDTLITYQHLMRLKYMEMVIKETLRLYPPVPIISRTVDEDAEFNGRTIPKGTTITMSIYHVNRDSDYHQEAEKFNPNRYMDSALNKMSPYAYIPFSAGPRNCIGQKFAILEMKTLISKILMHFEILPANPPEELQLVNEIIMKSKNGVNIRLKEY